MTSTLAPLPNDETLIDELSRGPASNDPRFRRLFVARPGDPKWANPALVILLSSTAVLYVWGLGSEGWANSFYSAAVQAGTKSWKAFFFGSFDASNFITVDKPPASLWVMELSARIFGLNSWSLLVPQALEGVATVGVLSMTVKRWFGLSAGLVAGAVVALTPVAALMFRYDNPDALLVLLLTLAAYATSRALDSGRTRWLVLAMAFVGTGFITKMMQAFLVVPAIGLVYLIAGPPKLGRRILQLLIGTATLIAASGWWVAIVELVPARDRPYVGGSQDNNLFNLIFGYNGFGRVTGSESGSAASQWGPTGWDRLFLPSFGSQISWLIPGSLVLMAAALWITRGHSRTDRTRAALVLWGGWLLVTGLLLSYAKGIIHPYYTIALAPAIGAIVAIGGVTVWRRRISWFGRAALAGALLVTTWWAFVLLGRSATWMPELRLLILAIGLVGTGVLLIANWTGRRVEVLIGSVALAAALAGPAAYTIDTVAAVHTGAIPSAGPTQAGATGFGAGGAPGAGNGAFGGGPGGPPPNRSGTAAGAQGSTGTGPGGFGVGTEPSRANQVPNQLPNQLPSGFANRSGGGAAGGLLNSSTPSAALTRLLESDASSYTWVAATVGSNSAAGYQLATRDPVMAIGGFNGTDPTPTLSQFETDVDARKIHYFISGGGSAGGGGPSTSSAASAITSWVETHFQSTTVGGVTIYNLSTTTNN